jgi:Protein of unknown function (DUF4013)
MIRTSDPPPLPTLPPPLPHLPPPLPDQIYRDPIPPPLPLRKARNEFLLIIAGIEWIFGLFCLIGGLAFLASVPLLSFLSLGYMLEAGGRVALSGRIREGFIGVRIAARLGGIVLASWLFLLPVRLLADWTFSAQIINPNSQAEGQWRLGLYIVAGLVFLHITMACARGGKLRYFLWPFNFIWVVMRLFRGGYYQEARDAVWDFTVGLRLPHYFWLGLRGCGVAIAWLIIPVSLLALGHSRLLAAGFVGVIGGVMLAVVLLYLPFLQLRMAARNKFSEGFNLFAVRRDFRKAPWAFAMAVFFTLLFAVPLYLFKIETVPSEATWLPGLIFIAFIYPARILTGWALGRAGRRAKPRHWFFRWTGRLPLLPIAGFYVLIVFFAQYTSWNGVFSMYEQHAFLVPVPFVGL